LQTEHTESGQATGLFGSLELFNFSETAQAPGNAVVADTLAAAIGRQQERERLVARKRKQEEEKAAHRHEEEAVMSGLRHELRTLRSTDPDMTLLDAVEYITPDPDRRIALYRCCSAEDGDIKASRLDQDEPRLFGNHFVSRHGSRFT
jgi:hypothetical protein